MATTINADTSTGGAVVTGDASGVLALQAAGVTKVTINSSGVVLANPLPVASGGTGGSATPTAGGVVYGTGSAQAITAAGTSGQVLQSNGASAPSWVAVPAASPGGSTTQLQYNNAGSFGGISGVTTDGTRMTASTTIGVGGATPSTSGSGITFPATQSASTNANTLDDYEEGTWTIGIPDHQGTATSFTRSGSYVKIGRVVYIIGSITPTNGTFGSYGRSTGLPFTVSVFGSGGMCNFTNLDTPGSLSFSTQSNPIAWVFNATVPSGCQVIFSGFYLTAD